MKHVIFPTYILNNMFHKFTIIAVEERRDRDRESLLSSLVFSSRPLLSSLSLFRDREERRALEEKKREERQRREKGDRETEKENRRSNPKKKERNRILLEISQI